ncbi:MAG: hypothetical protein GXO56_00970 [Chloroflexi bacterium]|nr:hypothetical protein [Chloroflexota bacterium]
MQPLPFRPPARLTLAADARLAEIQPGNDHVWTLYATHGTWEALTLTTTYGLRVQEMSLFPFMETEGQRRWMPTAFAVAPTVHALHPGYAHLTCEPFPGLRLTCRYWIAHSQAVVGQIGLENIGETDREGALGLAAVLRPLPGEEGGGMEPQQGHAVNILQGSAGGLAPVLFLTGGAESRLSPFPALSVPFSLAPGASRRLTWVLTSLEDAEAGFALARQLAARPWPPFEARLSLAEAPIPTVEASRPALTWALMRGRQSALRLLSPHPDLPKPFFVTARNPDHGGPADPLALNRAPSVLEAYYLAAGFFLPTHPTPVQGWVDNFLSRQQENGFIPWKPSQGTQGYLASPLLVELAFRAYAHDPRKQQALYPALRRFVEAWFTQADTNGDGLPEWAHPLQMGLPDPPGFAPWRRESVGADFATVESPALYALLVRALDRLEQMAEAAEATFPKELRGHRRRLTKALQEMWDARRRSALYRDRDTHQRPAHQTLGKHRGPGALALAADFTPASRVVVHIFPEKGQVRPVTITLRGTDSRGKPLTETFSAGQVQWFEGRGVLTSRGLYRHLETVSVEGLRSRGRFAVLTPDLYALDISLLLPFWAQVWEPAQAEAVKRALTSERAYGRPYGAPVSPQRGRKATAWQRAVRLPWNVLAIEGLLAYGYVDEAATLLQNLGQASKQTLESSGAFWEAYHAETGEGLEGQDVLAGFPPVALWMRTAGIQPVSPHKVRFVWPTPFQDEFVVRFWGWTIRRSPDLTLVVTPDGQEHTLTTAEPYEIEVR